MLATSESRVQLMVVVDSGLPVAPAKIHFSPVTLSEKVHKANIQIFQDAAIGPYLTGKPFDSDEILHEFGCGAPADVASLRSKQVGDLLTRFHDLGSPLQELIHQRFNFANQAICFFYREVSRWHGYLTHKAGRL